MAAKKGKVSSLFADSRSRIILILGLAFAVGGILLGLTQLFSSGADNGDSAGSALSSAPAIESIPGSINPTEQYAKLQEEENTQKAIRAKQSGGSSIPTIIRTERFGEGNAPIGNEGEAGVGFSTLALGGIAGNPLSWLDDLKASQCAKKDVDFARSKGAATEDLLQACSCLQLKAHGFNLKELLPGCKCTSLRDAGYSAKELKDAGGFTARQLKVCGFSACALRAAGFTAAQLKAAGFSDGELRGAGFSEADIRAASGVPDTVSDDEIKKAGCSALELRKLRAKGVSAAAIRKISGCSVEQLKAAGFTAKELKEAGFTAAELKAAGFTDEELKRAGYSDAEIEKANLPGDCSVESIRKARARGVTAREIREELGCSAKALKAAGFSAKELRDAGFTAAELKAAGFSAKELRSAGFSAAELKEAGFSAAELKEAGFSAAELKDAGFSAEELRAAGFSAAELKDAGFSAEELRAAGFSATELLSAGFTAKELLDAGFSTDALKAAGVSNAELGITQSKDEVDTSEFAFIKDENLKKALQASKEKRIAAQNRTDIKKIQANMKSYAATVVTAWEPIDQATVVKEEQEGLAGGDPGDAPGTPGAPQATGPAMIKAGDVLFAVLETAINTDEPGPILARIAQGRFKGSKLIGTVEVPNQGKKAVLKFTNMSIPGADNTIAINSVAIDMNTARTALSSRTNNHYITRYGSLFASSFLEGFGKSITGVQTQINTLGGSLQTQQAAQTTGESLYASLGTIGQKWGEQVGSFTDKPPTIYIYSGVGMGILFLADVAQVDF